MSPQEQSELDRVKRAAADLGEHFDSVQIFVTRYNPGADDDPDSGTVNIDFGSGNWFARLGQILTWISKSDQRTRIEVSPRESEE